MTNNKENDFITDEDGKEFYQSKTFWVNVLYLIGIIIQSKTGFIVPAEFQATLLALINSGLRLITSEPIK